MNKYDATLGPALLGADPFAAEHLAALRSMVVRRSNPARNLERRVRRNTQAARDERSGFRVEKDTGQHPKFAVERKHNVGFNSGAHCVPAHPIRDAIAALRAAGNHVAANELHGAEVVRNARPTELRMARSQLSDARNKGASWILAFIQEGIDANVPELQV